MKIDQVESRYLLFGLDPVALGAIKAPAALRAHWRMAHGCMLPSAASFGLLAGRMFFEGLVRHVDFILRKGVT